MSEENAFKAMIARYSRLEDWVRECVICPPTVPDREHMERAARAYLATYLNGDLEGRAALLAEDAIFEDPVGTTPLQGMAQIMPFWRMADEAGWWCAHDVRTVVVSGPHVMLHFISNMRLPGLEPATMEVFESQTFNAEGKITHVRVYFDAQGLGRR